MSYKTSLADAKANNDVWAKGYEHGARETAERIASFCDQMTAPGLDELHRAAYEHVARVARGETRGVAQ